MAPLLLSAARTLSFDTFIGNNIRQQAYALFNRLKLGKSSKKKPLTFRHFPKVALTPPPAFIPGCLPLAGPVLQTLLL